MHEKWTKFSITMNKKTEDNPLSRGTEEHYLKKRIIIESTISKICIFLNKQKISQYNILDVGIDICLQRSVYLSVKFLWFTRYSLL